MPKYRSMIPSSSNSRSRSASWSLSPCNLPLVAIEIDGGIWKCNSAWPSNPDAAAAWALACAWSCWHVAYILRLVAITKTASIIQSWKGKGRPLFLYFMKKRGSMKTSSIYTLYLSDYLPENNATSEGSLISWISK